MDSIQRNRPGSEVSSSGNNDQNTSKSTVDSPQIVAARPPVVAAGAEARRRHPTGDTLPESMKVIESEARLSLTQWRSRSDSSASSASDDEDEISKELAGGKWKESEMGLQRQETLLSSTKALSGSPRQSDLAEEDTESAVFCDDFSTLTLEQEARFGQRKRLQGESDLSASGESEAFSFSSVTGQREQLASPSMTKESEMSGKSGGDLAARFEQKPEITEWSIRTDDELQSVRAEPESISPLVSESSTAHEFLEVEDPEFRSLPTYHDDNYSRQPFFAGKSMQSEEKQLTEVKETDKGAALIAQSPLRSPSRQVKRSVSADDSNIAGGGSQTKGKRKRQADHFVSSGEYHSLPPSLSTVEPVPSARKPKRVRSDETLPPEAKEKRKTKSESP